MTRGIYAKYDYRSCYYLYLLRYGSNTTFFLIIDTSPGSATCGPTLVLNISESFL